MHVAALDLPAGLRKVSSGAAQAAHAVTERVPGLVEESAAALSLPGRRRRRSWSRAPLALAVVALVVVVVAASRWWSSSHGTGTPSLLDDTAARFTHADPAVPTGAPAHDDGPHAVPIDR